MPFPILGTPKPQFFDSSGSPLVSGTLTIQEPADDTNKASYPTYDDAVALTNANTNPLTLDSRGETTNGLWGLDGEDYKVVLKDSNGDIIWTVDDIMGSRHYQITAAEIAAGVTPTNYSYEPGNVLRYGTNTTPGTTDMTTALNNAGKTGYPVVVPENIVVTSIAWTVAVDITISSGASILHSASGTDDMLQSTVGLTIRGGTIDGNRSNRTWSDTQLPVYGESGYVRLFGVHFKSSLHAAFRVQGTVSELRVEGCQFDDMAEHPGTGSNSTAAGIIRADDGAEMQVWLINNKVSAGTPSVAGRGPGGFLWDGGAAASGTGIKRVIAQGNHFTNIGQNAASNLIGCLHGYTNGGEFIGGGNEFKGSYWVALLLQNARKVNLGSYVVTDHVDGINGVQVQVARSFTPTVTDIDIGHGVITYAAGATTGIGLVILGEATGANYIKRIVGGPVIVTGGATGIRIQYAQSVSLLGPIVDSSAGAGIEIQNTSNGTDAPTNATVSITGGRVANCGGIGISTAASNVDNLHLNVTGMEFEANTTNHVRADSSSRLNVTGCNFVDDLSQVVRAQSMDYVSVIGNTGTTTATTSTTSSTTVNIVGNSWQALQDYTTGAHTTLRDFTGTTTAAEALQLLETLVDDLISQGILK